ncbi:acyltransferase family protein [Rhizobium sp. WW22]|uniref:acyltransferase family protein n=1 Tax=Rhizobium sp. WW22 TaxID=3389070 RepID=UPI00399BEBAD
METKRLDALTSLRFFAAGAVVIFHGKAIFGMPSFLANLSLTQAVSFFFVLSGFILAYGQKSLETPEEIFRFYVGRVARIWPAHVVSALVAIIIILHQGAAISPFAAAMNLLLLQSWVPDPGVFFSLNGVSWSLSDEIFFYILFPFIVLAARTQTLKWLLGSAIATALMIGAVSFASDHMLRLWGASISPLTRLSEFVLGIAASQVFGRVRGVALGQLNATILEIAALISVILAMRLGNYDLLLRVGIPDAQALWFANTGGGFAFAFAITVLALQQGAISRLLQARVLVYLGEISFALYLTHQLVFRTGIWSGSTADLIIYWAATILAAMGLHHFVERPFQRIIMRRAPSSKLQPVPNNR